MKKYNLVVSDLDRTFISRNNKVPDFNIEVVNQIRKKGVKFCVATGRSFDAIIHILKSINTNNSDDEYSIILNGSVIVTNKSKNIIYFNGLNYSLSLKIFEFGKNYDIMIMFYTIDYCYCYKPINEILKIKNIINEKYIIIEDIESLKNEKIAKIVFCKFDKNYLEKIGNEILKLFNEEIEISFSSEKYLEINIKGANKGSSLKFLSNYLKINISEIIAIGDNDNDLPMIEYAGLGICVANANDNVKKKCDYICQNNNENGGVKEALEKFILNN